MKPWKVGDNSGSRRRQEVLSIERKDVEGLKPGDEVRVVFDDEYIRCGCQKAKTRRYTVEEIKFQDEFKRERGIHLVRLRKIKEVK